MPTDAVLHHLAPWLRERVACLRASTMCRSFPPSLEVLTTTAAGEPVVLGHCARLGPLDRGLRVDLLCRLMSEAPGPVAVVVVRAGHHGARTDADVAWVGAALAAAGVCRVRLAAVLVVSRWGWLELLGGHRRDWKRLRVRTRPARSVQPADG